jgi:ABC-type Fe3+ transport system permease subunit
MRALVMSLICVVGILTSITGTVFLARWWKKLRTTEECDLWREEAIVSISVVSTAVLLTVFCVGAASLPVYLGEYFAPWCGLIGK